MIQNLNNQQKMEKGKIMKVIVPTILKFIFF
jgi:hypothetical protein